MMEQKETVEEGAGGKPEEPIPQGQVSRKSLFIWLGVVVIGLVWPFVWPFFVGGHDHGTASMAWGMVLTYVGLAGAAYTAGRSPLWALWGLLVLWGPLIAVGLLAWRGGPVGTPTKGGARRIVAGLHWIIVCAMLVPIPFLARAMFGSFPYQQRARQAEARTNLGGIFVAQIAFHGDHGRYGRTFEEIGYTLAGQTNRYTYRLDGSGRPGTILPAGQGTSTPDNTVVPAGISPTGFTATATANLDSDPALDQWHVNDAKCCLQQADVNDAPGIGLMQEVLSEWRSIFGTEVNR